MKHEENSVQSALVARFKDKIENKINDFQVVCGTDIFKYKIINNKCYIHSNVIEGEKSFGAIRREDNKGRLIGISDLTINYFNTEKQMWSFFYIEVKTPEAYSGKNNGLRDTQIKFMNSCKELGISYFIAYNDKSFMYAMETMGLIQSI